MRDRCTWELDRVQKRRSLLTHRCEVSELDAGGGLAQWRRVPQHAVPQGRHGLRFAGNSAIAVADDDVRPVRSAGRFWHVREVKVLERARRLGGRVRAHVPLCMGEPRHVLPSDRVMKPGPGATRPFSRATHSAAVGPARSPFLRATKTCWP